MKRYFVLLVVLAVLFAAGFIYRHKAQAPVAEDEQAVKQLAWDAFDRYRTALKAHDKMTVASLSYQTSTVCSDPKQESTCFARMDQVYNAVKAFKEADFTNIAYDRKQIIMYGDWHEEETDLAFGDAREMMYFTRKADGTPQVLFLTQPEEIVYTLKGKGDSKDAMRKELAPRLVDSDGDTLEDEVETCSYPNAPKTCVKTDPHKKDTDGDGWWDSTEQWFLTK